MAGRLGCLVIIPFRALGVENEVRAPCGKGASPDPRSPWTCLLLLIPRPSTPALPPGQACCTAHSPPALQVSPRSWPPGSPGPAPPTPCGLWFPGRHLSGLVVSPCVLLAPPASSPCLALALHWPCPLSPICLSAPLSVPVSVALSLSIQLSVTPSALPCSPPLSPLSWLEVSPSVPPPRPLPRAPCPSTLTDSAGVLSYGLVQAKFSILLAFFPLWLM